jgi:hypothetical protein
VVLLIWMVTSGLGEETGFDLLTSSDLGPSSLPAAVSTIVIVQGMTVVAVLAVRRERSRRHESTLLR